MIRRLAITGSSGYLGSKVVDYYRGRGATVLGIDIQPPGEIEPDEFVQSDIRETRWARELRLFRPDTVIHAAFVFQPIRDLKRMREINVGGTENILAVVEQVAPSRVMVISSATAFGAWPDNPVPMAEDWPLRPRHDYQYAADKTGVERLVADFAERHPEICVSWVRPAIVGGPQMHNFLYRFIFGMPFLAKLDGFDTPMQFVHEDDVVAAIDAILSAKGRGAYNLGPPNWTSVSEIAQETDRRVIWMPFRLAWLAAWLAWNVRLWIHESPAGFLYFARYPWVVAPNRLLREIGYEFRYSSTETVREVYRHQQAGPAERVEDERISHQADHASLDRDAG